MNRNRLLKLWMTCFAIAALCAFFAASAIADPIVGRDLLKFSQRPMDGTPITSPNGTVQRFWGHDELSTAYSFGGAGRPTPYRALSWPMISPTSSARRSST